MICFRYVNQVITREKRSSVSGLLCVPKSRAQYYKRFILEFQQLCFGIRCQIVLLSRSRELPHQEGTMVETPGATQRSRLCLRAGSPFTQP